MSLFSDTAMFAKDANLPWHFTTFNGEEVLVIDALGRLVHHETYKNFTKHSEDNSVAFEAWQQSRIRWQFIVHASQLLPQMFAVLAPKLN